MVAHDIAYIELYTKDKVSAIDHLVSGLGFTRVADSVEADRSSVLLRQGSVQVVLTSGRGVWRFLDEHGDGVVDVALTCDDVVATTASAAAAGAKVTTSSYGPPVASGFGDVNHSLVHVGVSPSGLPPGRNWVYTPGVSLAPSGRIEALDHVAVCVEGGSLDSYADFYRDGFGLARYSSEYVALDEQAMDSVVVRSPSGNVIFTLVAPDPAKARGQLTAFLQRNGGEGVQHLAFRVDRIADAVREYRDGGAEFLAIPDAYYDMLGERITALRGEIGELKQAQVLADRDEWATCCNCSPGPRTTGTRCSTS